MYRKVLLPIDGSAASLAALPHAARVVDAGGEVHVLQVIAILPERVAAEMRPPDREDVARDMALDEAERDYRQARRNVDTAADALRARGVSQPVTAVLGGSADDAIAGYVQSEGCDLVVMGTHGRTGLRRVLLGSTAQGVLERVRAVPVMLVRPDATED
jgi:nucleotide-binding universal stress UspA family protein